jgi:Uma2 family endonuclease
MTLAPPAPAAPQAPASGLERLVLPPGLKLSAEQFALVCEANPEAVLELTAAGQVIAMTPTGGDTSARNNLLSARLQVWALGQGGWEVFDSSGGFRLPDGSVLSPDAAIVRRERWQSLTPEQRRGFPPLCPDLVVELVSPSVAAGFSEGVEGPRGSEALRRRW